MCSSDLITGFLMCEGASFLQLIEGPADAIGQTFHRIQGDRRHERIEVLLDASCDARSVPAWATGVFFDDEGEAGDVASAVIERALGHQTPTPEVREVPEKCTVEDRKAGRTGTGETTAGCGCK